MKSGKKAVLKAMCSSVILFFVVTMAGPGACFGAGYGLYEWGARGNALGGAIVARADDPTAVAYNPAGITQLPGKTALLGATVISPSLDINIENGPGINGTAADNTWIIPSGYYTQQISQRYWLGLAIYSRAGLGTEVEDTDQFAGRYNCSYAGLKSASINPNLAVKITDALSVAVGVEALWLEFSYDKYTDVDRDPDTDTDIKQEIRADGWEYGYNLALHYKPRKWLALGASFRSEIQLSVEGTADFSWSSGATASWDADLLDTDVQGTEPIPQLISLGIVRTPFERWSLEIDAVHTRWSAYDQLVVEYDNDLGDQASVKCWNDTWRFQAGLEYKVYDWLDLRAGYVFDESPIPDEYVDYAVPANDRQLYSLGAGVRWRHWTFDFSYTYLVVMERDITARSDAWVYEGKFENGSSHLIGMSAALQF
jgi:long-chain fatty acid transport protein